MPLFRIDGSAPRACAAVGAPEGALPSPAQPLAASRRSPQQRPHRHGGGDWRVSAREPCSRVRVAPRRRRRGEASQLGLLGRARPALSETRRLRSDRGGTTRSLATYFWPNRSNFWPNRTRALSPNRTSALSPESEPPRRNGRAPFRPDRRDESPLAESDRLAQIARARALSLNRTSALCPSRTVDSLLTESDERPLARRDESPLAESDAPFLPGRASPPRRRGSSRRSRRCRSWSSAAPSPSAPSWASLCRRSSRSASSATWLAPASTTPR